jgi:Ger(x)C family germination protein
MKGKSLLLLLLILTITLTGCWDRMEIETRGYVLGIAIDLYPPNPLEKEQGQSRESSPEEEKLEKMEMHSGEPQYTMTVQVPILKESDSQGGGNSTGGSKTWEITQIGNSFMSMNREMQSRTSLSLYYEHLQVIILSEKVARRGIEDVLDFFIRDPEMRRRVKIFISQGEAKSVLEVKPKVADFASIYLTRLPMNATKNSRMIHKTDLGEVIQSIHAGFDFILPMTRITDDEIKASGGAAFKKDKMVGWVSELEIEAIKLIRNLYLGGVIIINSPDQKGGIVVMEVVSAKSKITPLINGDQVTFNVDIKVEGNYAEDVNMHTHSQINEAYLNKLEKEYAKEIERICVNTVNKMQTKYGVDVFRFNQILQAEKPAYWKKIGHKWDTVYPEVDVNIKADVSIRLIGLVD